MERDLIEALTTELERAETTIQNLVHLLKTHDLLGDSALASQVHDRQLDITAVAGRGRAWLEQQEARAKWD